MVSKRRKTAGRRMFWHDDAAAKQTPDRAMLPAGGEIRFVRCSSVFLSCPVAAFVRIL